MIRKIKNALFQIKNRFFIFKLHNRLFPNKNNANVISQLAKKGLVDDSIKEKFLKDDKSLSTSKLIESLIRKRIEYREKKTNEKYLKIIENILQEEINNLS